MSGISTSTICPNCGANCDLYSDWKPFDYSVITCLSCGLLLAPKLSYYTLKELNFQREEAGLEPLDRLPEQSENIW